MLTYFYASNKLAQQNFISMNFLSFNFLLLAVCGTLIPIKGAALSSAEESAGSSLCFCVVEGAKEFAYDKWEEDWSIKASATKWSGVSEYQDFVQIKGDGTISVPGKGFFYFLIPNDTQALRFSIYWDNSELAYASSLVYPVVSDAVFHISILPSLTFDSEKTSWAKWKFSAEQLAGLVVANVDPSRKDANFGYGSFPFVKNSIVENMDPEERTESKWASIAWQDTFENKKVSLAQKYQDIEKLYQSGVAQIDQPKPSGVIYLPLVLSCLCFGFLVVTLFYQWKKKNSGI
jgi:hypothetical protein